MCFSKRMFGWFQETLCVSKTCYQKFVSVWRISSSHFKSFYFNWRRNSIFLEVFQGNTLENFSQVDSLNSYSCAQRVWFFLILMKISQVKFNLQRFKFDWINWINIYYCIRKLNGFQTQQGNTCVKGIPRTNTVLPIHRRKYSTLWTTQVQHESNYKSGIL